MKVLSVFFLASVAISPVFTQFENVPVELSWDVCPTPRNVINFDPQRFAGTWYDVERYRNAIFTGKCGRADFMWNSGRERMTLTYSNQDDTEEITLRPVNLRNGEFRMYRNGRRTPIVVHILDTDYANYAILWSCTDVLYGVGNAQTLNILSRRRILEPALLDTAMNAVTSRNLDENRLSRVMQDRRECRNQRADYDY